MIAASLEQGVMIVAAVAIGILSGLAVARMLSRFDGP